MRFTFAPLEVLLSQVHPDDRNRVKSAFEKVSVGSVPEKNDQEFRIIHSTNGEVGWLRVKAKLQVNTKGTAYRFSGVVSDVSTSKGNTLLKYSTAEPLTVEWPEKSSQIREDLSRDNSIINTILGQLDEVIGLYDCNTYVLYFNDKTLSLLGLKKDQVLGKLFLDAFPQSKDSSFHQLLLRAIAGEKIYREEHQSILNGRVYENTLSPLLDHNGNVYAVLTISYDITVRQQDIEKIRASNEALQSVNRELEQFAFVTSHDLQEPLRKIEAFSDRLYRTNQTNVDGKGLEYILKISASAARMSSLVKGLLEYSRTTRDMGEVTTVDLNKIISEILQDVELAIEERMAVVDYSELPTIEAIPLQMHRLFYNLITNGLKFTSLQLPRIEIQNLPVERQELIQLTLDPTREYVHIVVTDNGIGLQPGDAEKIFKMFHRVSDSAYPGFGIGLAICKKIVDTHHGLIYATGRPNEGSSFHVLLPVRQYGIK